MIEFREAKNVREVAIVLGQVRPSAHHRQVVGRVSRAIVQAIDGPIRIRQCASSQSDAQDGALGDIDTAKEPWRDAVADETTARQRIESQLEPFLLVDIGR